MVVAVHSDFDSESNNGSSAVRKEFTSTEDSLNTNARIGGEQSSPPFQSIEEVSLIHDTLQTKFIGVRHHVSQPTAEVLQFRGIKYAQVPKRFRRSVLHETFPQVTYATKNGPICPQIRNRKLETRLYGLPRHIIPEKEKLEENEFECLNLTITAPSQKCLVVHAPLPVMVWIHGGGNVTGCATDWIWDAGALVKRSIEIGNPVLVVSINYRLGLFGFGASELLKEDNASAGEIGVGNYGLHDQRTALQWIRKHISGFGGDPWSVTLFGSSWGAADIHAHLLSSANLADVFAAPDQEGPLFHRAILQSGALVPSSSVVQDIGSAGHHLGRIMSNFHVTTIEQLRGVPAQKLVQATGERVRPVDDGVFLRSDWRTLALPYSTSPDVPRSWRQDVIIGDVACESVLWAAPARMWAADAVARRARAVVQSVRRVDALMRAYDIVDGPTSPTRELPLLVSDSAISDDDENYLSSGSDEGEDELAERVMELMNDVAFAWPVDVAARCATDSAFLFDDQVRNLHDEGHLSTVSESESSPSPSPNSSEYSLASQKRTRYANAPYVYRYVFDQASPYTGTPHHGVDLLYLFGNIPFPTDPEFTPEENEEVNLVHTVVRDELQARWLMFASGKAPWDPLTPQPPAGVAGMSDRGLFATPLLAPVSSFPGGLTSSSGTASPSSATSRSSSFSSAFGPGNPFAMTANQHHAQHAPQQHHQPQHHLHHQHPQHHHHHHHHHHYGPHLYGPGNPPPISISESDKVFVFGPEGETGLRSATIFAGRRRVHAWRSALAPLGLATAQKVGLELGNGPPVLGANLRV